MKDSPEFRKNSISLFIHLFTASDDIRLTHLLEASTQGIGASPHLGI